MKRLAFVLGSTLLMVTMLATPALAAAQKVDLVRAAAFPTVPGGGSVVFNNSAGPRNLEVTVALKGVTPNTAYDVWVYVDVTGPGTKIGTVTTNGAGNATLHVNTAVALGTHTLGVDVVYMGSFSDVYLTAGFYGPGMSATLTFK